jgi:nucleotide-binding universal stress UspA family protein
MATKHPQEANPGITLASGAEAVTGDETVTRAAPLSPVEAHRAEEEARHQAAMASSGYFNLHVHGKVEAETRRITEEVTREARERLHAAQALSSAPAAQTAAIAERDQESDQTLCWCLPFPGVITGVIVPLDGSPFAERTLPYATAIAQLLDISITLVHVNAAATGWQALLEGQTTDDIRRYEREMHGYLECLRMELPVELQQRIEVVLQRAPTPARGLLELEQAQPTQLVVMTTHARQGAQRFLAGSVADELLRHGSSPILLVPPNAADRAQQRPVFTRAIVPLDGSLLAEQALGALGGLLPKVANAKHALHEVTLLTVVEHPTLVDDAESYLAAVRRQLEASYDTRAITIRTVTAVGDPCVFLASIVPGGVVANGAPSIGVPPFSADLLVMATHGRGGLGRWLLGSVATSVLARTILPMLLVHPPTTEL